MNMTDDTAQMTQRVKRKYVLCAVSRRMLNPRGWKEDTFWGPLVYLGFRGVWVWGPPV